ncbi:putative oxygen-dependent coproporphyrinogen-III oxidase [Colletotrichum spaethianum]|uniref:Oxygen-dependent coproporphyrinogen-III oxidase n=1 Tax=Colletotrichum spaethianum TaxID=700344 RepID=A0AA37PAV3_9PEZI|nr:putative oxygen-dependent coproporphyrinogen-III oxidase [Colletotrichum spaethianum]GKT48799.1 putative oxygen-dependent coproporphyrinogen-III oxidase [Colletotrichum spaethianum]
MAQPRPLLVVIGAGSMGLCIARRLGSSHHILVGDYSPAALSEAKGSLDPAGHLITTKNIDVSSETSVASFAKTAAELGPIKTVILTAGVSSAANDTQLIYATNLTGTALVLDSFLPLMPPGSSLTIIASVAGHLLPPNPGLETHLATAPTASLITHHELDHDTDSSHAYGVSKLGCIVRAQYKAAEWGRKGVRINTVSPGAIETPMLGQVLRSEQGPFAQSMINNTPLGRTGTSDEIAGIVAFLAGPDTGFVTGADLVIDGGALSAHRWPGAVAGLKHKVLSSDGHE